MGLSDWLFGATPGQQAGQAVKEVIGGVFQGIDEIIDNFHLEPEKALEAKIKLKELQLHTLEVRLADVQSARAMQVSTRSWWPGILSFVSITGFLSLFYVLINQGLPESMPADVKVLVNTMIGALIGYVGTVFTFWMGSSSGSQDKNDLLHRSKPAEKE